MLPSCFFCPITASVFSPLSVTTIRLLPPSSFVLLVLEQNLLRSFPLGSFVLRTKSAFAVRTGLEPATPGVTGRYSNQLNYRTNLFRLMRFSRTRMQRYAKKWNLQIFCALFCVFLSFNHDFSSFVLCLRFLQFRDNHCQDAIIYVSINVFLVRIVRKKKSLVKF